MVKHTTFYRGHRIELVYESGRFESWWHYRIEGRACYAAPDTRFTEDYYAHEEATQVIDAEITEMEGALSNASR